MQGWGKHPGKSGHGQTNILTFDTSSQVYIAINTDAIKT